MPIDPGDAPLYEIKANLFKGLAHPARIRVLELLSEAEEHTAPVAHLLEHMDIEPSHLSQHLKVLRRHRVVVSERRANHVLYTLADPCVADLLAIARLFLTNRLAAESTAAEAAPRASVR